MDLGDLSLLFWDKSWIFFLFDRNPRAAIARPQRSLREQVSPRFGALLHAKCKHEADSWLGFHMAHASFQMFWAWCPVQFFKKNSKEY